MNWKDISRCDQHKKQWRNLLRIRGSDWGRGWTLNNQMWECIFSDRNQSIWPFHFDLRQGLISLLHLGHDNTMHACRFVTSIIPSSHFFTFLILLPSHSANSNQTTQCDSIYLLIMTWNNLGGGWGRWGGLMCQKNLMKSLLLHLDSLGGISDFMTSCKCLLTVFY